VTCRGKASRELAGLFREYYLAILTGMIGPLWEPSSRPSRVSAVRSLSLFKSDEVRNRAHQTMADENGVAANRQPVTVKAALATPAPPSLSASTPRRSLYPPKQWSFFAFAGLVLPLIFALGYVSVHLHYELPEPRVEQFSLAGQPTFSEVSAMRYIRDLAAYADGTPKYRIVGTKEMVETDNYILDEIAAIREQVVRQHPDGGMQIEVFHQVRPAGLFFHYTAR
jgi:hypothetical protein